MSEADAKGCPVGAGDASYDPFEEFNRAQGIGKVEDPYTQFKEKRDRCPVHHRPGVAPNPIIWRFAGWRLRPVSAAKATT